MKIKVTRRFPRLTTAALEMLAKSIFTALTNNPAFPAPFVPLDKFLAALTRYSEALVAALNGGRKEIAERNEARKELEQMLGLLATYVENTAPDLPTLLTSGFQPAGVPRPMGDVTKPVIQTVENTQTTRMAVRLQTVPAARAYEVRMSYGTNGWQVVGIFTHPRKIVLTDLTPGTTYTVQARAIGSNGTSEWSDPVSRMSL
ncbi:MAG TPA: hypothetical protein VEH04_00515 [Verrucomicrobiae bacterium]|nr:hypothetical protein [Verrucomicrobiae bacterium]